MARKNGSDIDEARRNILLSALSAGLFAGGLNMTWLPTAQAGPFGKTPKKMPDGRSIYKLKGDVQVNGNNASLETRITTDDTVSTGKNSQVIFVVGQDAFILRSNSELTLTGTGILIRNLRLLTGKLLSVFGRRNRDSALTASTATATIGIRGTGVYLESEQDLSYVCTCYGETQLSATADPSSSERIKSTHHDAPRYIAVDGARGKRIRPAPMKNHTDLELMLIEELVGRAPPFTVSDSGYNSLRRRY